MTEWVPSEGVRSAYARLLRRLPPRARKRIIWLLEQWPGRLAVRTMVASTRTELFDRSMTVAAQAFTSVVPILIVGATWLGVSGHQVSGAVGLPEGAQPAVDGAVTSVSSNQAFGWIGALAILASATSFSRALTRAFAAIWGLPRPRLRLRSAWRWVAVLVALAAVPWTARAVARDLNGRPGSQLWDIAGPLAVDIAVAFVIPLLLLAGRVRPRHLLPGALLFGAAMLVVRPSATVLLPHALAISDARYGAIGVAFTYVALLYAVSFCLLSSGILGQVITTDEGRLGRWLRGGPTAAAADTPGRRSRSSTSDSPPLGEPGGAGL